jgi:hypothetical protein
VNARTTMRTSTNLDLARAKHEFCRALALADPTNEKKARDCRDAARHVLSLQYSKHEFRQTVDLVAAKGAA